MPNSKKYSKLNSSKSNKFFHIIIIFGIFVVSICVIFFIILPFLYNLILGFSSNPSSGNNQIFKNYITFSKTVIPKNYKLVATKVEPYSVDSPYSVDQTFSITSTRKAIIEELNQILTKRKYSFTPVIITNRLADQQDFFNNNVRSQQYPTDIHIVFIPSDTNCNNPSPGTTTQCTSHDPFSEVTEVGISWEARGGD